MSSTGQDDTHGRIHGSRWKCIPKRFKKLINSFKTGIATAIDLWTSVIIEPNEGQLVIELKDMNVFVGIPQEALDEVLNGNKEPHFLLTSHPILSRSLTAIWYMMLDILNSNDIRY